MALNAGDRLGAYEIAARLGAGGMGEVYRARDTRLSRDVALKLLRDEVAIAPGGVERFTREARCASGLNHPNIVTIYEIGWLGTAPYIAMEFVPGETLRQKLADGPLPIEKLLSIALQVAK